MTLPTTTTQILREDIAGASSLLRFLNVNPVGEHQGSADAFTQFKFSTDAAMLSYELAINHLTRRTETQGWWVQFVELLVQSKAQPLTTQHDGWRHQWQTYVETPQRQPISWKRHIKDATKQEEIIAIVRLFGLEAIADRLSYLQKMIADDPDEQPIVLDSLRQLTLFLMSERQLPDPQIGVNASGLMQVEWRVPENGILAMEFLPSDFIRFAAVSAPVTHGPQRMTVSGTLRKDATLEAVGEFTSLIIGDEWQTGS